MWSASLPTVRANVGLWGATRRSACPILCHSESGPLSLSVRECGAAASASGQTACPVHPTLHQSWSRQGNSSPLRPGCQSLPILPVWMNVYFLFPWCWTSFRSIFRQFWLCEEAQCVYLHHHLGSPGLIFKLKQHKIQNLHNSGRMAGFCLRACPPLEDPNKNNPETLCQARPILGFSHPQYSLLGNSGNCSMIIQASLRKSAQEPVSAIPHRPCPPHSAETHLCTWMLAPPLLPPPV